MKPTKFRGDKPSPSLREVLYEFALAQHAPTRELLDDYVHRYPQYATALADLAVDLTMENGTVDIQPTPRLEGAGEVSQSPDVLRMISHFQNRLYQVRRNLPEPAVEDASAEKAANPFGNLPRSEIRSFARALDVSNAFVMKLRDCQIQVETMTEGFLSRVAELLSVSLDHLVAHLTRKPQIAADASFKAEKKPEAGAKQTFEEALRSSGLSEQQQAHLLQL